jgi:two-component system nitrogen regulation response regulator GlnG/two-component system response regulator HydG
LDHHGQARDEVLVALGETFEIEGQLAFVCVSRPDVLPRAREAATARAAHPFGEADELGIVGESPTAWQLREHVAFIAGRAAHVLVLGPSGAGKEVVAQAVHALSKRGKKPMVSRSAVTIPEGIADAELFGNLASYPNPGTPERKGLVGEADGTTLFLDELGELPEELQARLLRVLDERGEYQRLGEARVRRSDLRLVAATNRPITALKHDVAARFRLRLTVPGLDERREDIPLLARHLLRRVASSDDDIAKRFVDERGEPRLSFALVRALVGHTYRTHVRELETLLWIALAHAKGDVADVCPELAEELANAEGSTPKRAVDTVTEDEVRAALERHGGVQDRAYKELGLANRFVLHRLMKKWKIASK